MSILVRTDIGDRLTIRGTLTDEGGNVISGATVTVSVIPPSGTETSLGTAAEDGSTGVYEVSYDPAEAGSTLVRFESAAPNKAAAEGVIFVRESRFS